MGITAAQLLSTGSVVLMTNQRKKVIYDLGSNNGDDIPYYLKKADVVVAVEANPLLCKEIEGRFPSEIGSGKLFVENCVVTADDTVDKVYFYISNRNHVWSQFPRPDDSEIADFEKILLPSKAVLSLVEKYGQPYYIKIDIEHYDEAILRALFQSNIRPLYISAESHSIEVFSILVGLGGYRAFKLVDGATVSIKYNNHQITVGNKRESYSFPHDSAGPFGEDIVGDWLEADEFFSVLAIERLGWKDIHATSAVEPDPSAKANPSARKVIELFVRYLIKPHLPASAWNAIANIYGRLILGGQTRKRDDK
jgi:FkbM family methyltransferase